MGREDPQNSAVIEQEASAVVSQPQLSSLATLLEVRQEMERVYRDARTGRIPVADAEQRVRSLAEIGRAMKAKRQVAEGHRPAVATKASDKPPDGQALLEQFLAELKAGAIPPK